MSKVTSEERMEIFRSVIWMQTGVEPQGNKADLVFSERPFLSTVASGTSPESRVGAYSVSLATHTDEEILKALKWFKVI
jgi:hypothetical protein